MLEPTARKPLEDYLSLQYPFVVHADPDGGYVIVYPDLPGCLSQAETLDEIPAMAEEAREGWIETEYEEGRNIPEPSHQEFSGKFNVRIPKSLHRALVGAASQDGVSLNQYVVMLLSSGNALAQLKGQRSTLATMPVNAERRRVMDNRIEELEKRVEELEKVIEEIQRSVKPYVEKWSGTVEGVVHKMGKAVMSYHPPSTGKD